MIKRYYKIGIDIPDNKFVKLISDHLYSLGYKWCSDFRDESFYDKVTNECIRSNVRGIGVECNGRMSYNVVKNQTEKWYSLEEYVIKYDLVIEYEGLKMGLL